MSSRISSGKGSTFPTDLPWSDYSTILPLGQNANQFQFQKWWNQCGPILGQLFGIRALMDTLEETNIQELLLSELMNATKSMTAMTGAPPVDIQKPQAAAGVSRGQGREFGHFSLDEDENDSETAISDMLNRAQTYGTPAGRLGNAKEQDDEPRGGFSASRAFQGISSLGERLVNDLLRQTQVDDPDSIADSNATTVPLKTSTDQGTKLGPKSVEDILRSKISDRLNSESYLDQIAERVVLQLPDALRAYKLAKQAIIGKFFIGASAYVHSDIIKRMVDKCSQPTFLSWVQEQHLAQLFKCLHSVMLYGMTSHVHSSLHHTYYTIEFIYNSTWRREELLADFIERLHGNFEVLTMCTPKADHTMATQLLSLTFFKNLLKDPQLVDFYEPWLYKGEPLPNGGFPALTTLLVAWLEVRKLSLNYGFGKAKKKPQEHVKPAITTIDNKAGGKRTSHGKGSGTRPSQERPPDWIDICYYCTSNHDLDTCKNWIAANRPKITNEQKQKRSEKLKQILRERNSKLPANSKKKDGADLYFVLKKSQVSLSTTNNRFTPTGSPSRLKDHRGRTKYLHDLIMRDNGVNANVSSYGTALQFSDIRYLPKSFTTTTASGDTKINTAIFNPSVQDWFLKMNHAPC